MIGTFAEYVILGINVLFILYGIYLEKNVLKNDPKAAEKLIKSKEFFVYIENSSEKLDFRLNSNMDNDEHSVQIKDIQKEQVNGQMNRSK